MSVKTVIPGRPAQPAPDTQANPMYAPSAGAARGGKTYIPDVYLNSDAASSARDRAAQAAAADAAAHASADLAIRIQDRPIAGILFSVSRTQRGEIFPVYLGRNTIGSDPECDICLAEHTVSPAHAVLAVRRIRNTDGTMIFQATLTDSGSEYGTQLDGRPLEYDRLTCNGGEIIEAGCSYRLLLQLFDTVGHHLEVDPAFRAIERERRGAYSLFDLSDLQPDPADTPAVEPEPVYPNTIGISDERSFYAPTFKRKVDHSNKPTQS